MKLHLLATPLVAATLLLSTLGCSKKEDATPTPASNTASYKLGGVVHTCEAAAYTSSSGGTTPTDMLSLTLLTTPEPASGKEYAILYFTKATGQPTSAYQMSSIGYFTKGSSTGVLYSNNVTSVKQTSGGGFSGTFTGTFSSTSGQGGSAITEGVFTDVRP